MFGKLLESSPSPLISSVVLGSPGFLLQVLQVLVLSSLLVLSLPRLLFAQSPLVRYAPILLGCVLCIRKPTTLLPLLVPYFYTPNPPLFFYLLCVSSTSPPLSTLILVSLPHYEPLSLLPSGMISLHSRPLIRAAAA